MIYLAILLILTGLLIILVSLFLETRKVNSRIDDISAYHGRAEKKESTGSADYYDPEDAEIDLPDSDYSDYSSGSTFSEEYNLPHIDDDIFISFDDSSDTDTSSAEAGAFDFDESVIHDEDPYSEVFDDPESSHGTVSQEWNNGGGTAAAVMFDDHSGIIDYDSGEGIIDSTFKGYKNIKRVGGGELLLDTDGLNFYLDGRLYRFDFHRLSRLWTGKNYIAIPVKGGDSVKLFIIDGGELLIKTAEDYFNESRKD
jgi:hypothetical protein